MARHIRADTPKVGNVKYSVKTTIKTGVTNAQKT